jgi:hypothetical protein
MLNIVSQEHVRPQADSRHRAYKLEKRKYGLQWHGDKASSLRDLEITWAVHLAVRHTSPCRISICLSNKSMGGNT